MAGRTPLLVLAGFALAALSIEPTIAQEGRACAYPPNLRKDYTMCKVVLRYGEYRCRCRPLNIFAGRQRNFVELPLAETRSTTGTQGGTIGGGGSTGAGSAGAGQSNTGSASGGTGSGTTTGGVSASVGSGGLSVGVGGLGVGVGKGGLSLGKRSAN
jgi:hypothetical protein